MIAAEVAGTRWGELMFLAMTQIISTRKLCLVPFLRPALNLLTINSEGVLYETKGKHPHRRGILVG